VRLLLLPGMGDIHWVLLKLQSWLMKHSINEVPELSIWNMDNRPRSIEYLDRVPWVKKGNYVDAPIDKTNTSLFNKLYLQTNDTDCEPNFKGFDYLIGTNGNMRNGVSFSKILQADTNFYYGPVLTLEDLIYGQKMAAEGPYIVFSFSSGGMFAHSWCKTLTAVKLQYLIDALRIAFPTYRFIFTGCSWDLAFSKQVARANDIMMVGETKLGDFLGMLKFASAYIGWCGGNSILAQHLLTPTIAWWSRVYFPKHDRTGWEHPKARHMALDVEEYKTDSTPSRIITFLEESCQKNS